MASDLKSRTQYLATVLVVVMTTLGTYGMAQAEIVTPGNSPSNSYRLFIPLVYTPPPTCPLTSSATYDAIAFNGSPYKNNAISDENADFRLSILGYAPNNSALLDYVNYGGGGWTDDGPRFSAIFTPHRKPTFVKAYQVYQWNWNQGAGSVPPYGNRGALNSASGGVTAIDFGTTKGESLNIPERTTPNAPGDYRALVLYAGPRELTLAYMLQDQVVVNGYGYVVHMVNFCVDPNLVATYRAQLDSTGRRSSMKLPAIKNNQAVGSALGVTLTVAIRDGGAYMDPRGKTNWWYDLP
jgi:hypothetical protein